VNDIYFWQMPISILTDAPQNAIFFSLSFERDGHSQQDKDRLNL